MSSTPIEVHRDGPHHFTARNERGAQVAVGRDDTPDSFTPGEMLLAAIAACSAVTTENILVRRLGDETEQVVHADREKAPEDPHKFSSIKVAYDINLDAVEDPEERRKLSEAVQRAVERFCTVSRSVEEGTSIHLDPPG